VLMKNPKWTRDELIVSLDFYLLHTPSIPGKTSGEIIELSKFLNRLREQLGQEGNEKFRNPNGVYMKLMNFRRFDPNYEGKGLERGGKEDEVVWNHYSQIPAELHKLADTIRSFIESGTPVVPPTPYPEYEESEGEEGALLTRTHQYRERNTKIIKRKKEQVLQEKGQLSCEACSFNFVTTYGGHGDGFIECHHTKPVSELKVGEKTKLNALALLCSNCHRMIHRKRPWLSIAQLKLLLAK
jgi:5-methylcytosine-specific restriction enzyme A